MTTMPQDTTTFGGRLRDARRSAGLTQEELAASSGLTIRTISNLERDRTRYPHPDSVLRLAGALSLDGDARDDFIAAANRRQAAEEADPEPGPGPEPGPAQAVPRQLPAQAPQFVGRRAELATLAGLLDRAGSQPPVTADVVAIVGMAGVGKTTLTLHWAHRVADNFPDGQLYVNLHGFGPAAGPAEPAEVIRVFLDALGVPAERIPASAQAQAGLYRSLLAGRRTLLVLDNARDVEQVRPLLPGTPGCLALITSRAQLSGLAVAEGAAHLTLDVLTQDEAARLLAGRLSAERLAAEPAAATELITLCAQLPLALAIAAALAAASPLSTLASLTAELRDVAGRLDGLDAGDAASSIRAVFSRSYLNLSHPAQRMFRLLALAPGPDITAAAAASLAGLPPPAARQAIRELTAAHMLAEHAAGRYARHDLLATYAAEQVRLEEDDETRRAALRRVLEHYQHTAYAAACLLAPNRGRVTLVPAATGVTPEVLAGYQQALAWFDAEHQALLAAVSRAAEAGFGSVAWQLPWAMASFLDRRGYWRQQEAIQRTALAAATRQGDTAGQAVTQYLLGTACAKLGDYGQAQEHLTGCLKLYRGQADRSGEAYAYQALAWTAEQQGRYADALGYAEQGLAVVRTVDNQGWEAVVLNSVGWLHALLGHYEQARTFCRQALALHYQLGNRQGEGHSWDSLGYAEYHLGRYHRAVTCYTHALDLFQQLGDRYYEAVARYHLGDTHAVAGQPDAARENWLAALGILDRLNHPDATDVRAKLHQPSPVG
ncbi:MAG TPA: tetratricopeptide repeat protein [Streptosporangiaceae bacterium]|jgi:tetratricopeptide (TPR) repeat protein/transcriptional regulator with XRE-family HTH domain